MFKSLGVPEIILILVIVLIFFGVGKLPQVGDAMGKAIRNFRKGQKAEPEEDDGDSSTIKSSTEKPKKSKKTAAKKA